MRRSIHTLAAAAALALAGCATVDIDEAVRRANDAAPQFTQGKLALAGDASRQLQARQAATQLLSRPLAMDDAVQLALANSPALQALLFQGGGELAAASQRGRMPNPLFAFERVRAADELELGRLLSFGLLDLLTLAQRQASARHELAQAQVRLVANVVDHVTQTRQAWVRAVAAQQALMHARQVQRSAQASAELARRMEAVGNFTRLQRARQHAFSADAAAQLAAAAHDTVAKRETLVRQLGLTAQQAQQLQLPERLPELPLRPQDPADVSEAALRQRLDVRLAREKLASADRAKAMDLPASLVDVELGIRRDTSFDDHEGTRRKARGRELGIRLPLFDWGDARRAGMDAQSLEAAHGYDAVVRAASSQLRESYSAYRTAYDLARHYRDEIVPLRKTISEENLLRYNGMLIGVFELLADHRDQVGTVAAAIGAQEQFWLAHAGLAAALIGRPLDNTAAAPAQRAAGRGEAGH